MDGATRLALLQNGVAADRTRIEQRKGQRNALLIQKADLERQLGEVREAVATTTNVILVITEAAQKAREVTIDQVQQLTTFALQSVFGDTYQFTLEATTHGKAPAVVCHVVSKYADGEDLTTDGNDSRGGGIVDIQSTALRIAMLTTFRPEIDGSLLLDEPGKHVSEQFVQLLGGLLKLIAAEFGRQIIMVTHNLTLASMADDRYEVVLAESRSIVTKAA